jgi:hypothetical protein
MRSLLRNFPGPTAVIPAKAGIHDVHRCWIPAFAGMTCRSITPMRSEASLMLSSPFGRAEQHRALRGARSAHQQLASGGCLSAAATGRVASSARPAKTEQRKAALAQRGPSRQGRLFLVTSFGEAKEVTRPPGRTPGAASRSEQDPATKRNKASIRKADPVLSLSKGQPEPMVVRNHPGFPLSRE